MPVSARLLSNSSPPQFAFYSTLRPYRRPRLRCLSLPLHRDTTPFTWCTTFRIASPFVGDFPRWGVWIFGYLSPALRRAPPIYNPAHSLVFRYPIPSLQRDWIPTSESMAQILEPLPGLDLLSLPSGVGPMIMVTVGCEWFLTLCPQELPPTPRLGTIPLPLISATLEQAWLRPSPTLQRTTPGRR